MRRNGTIYRMFLLAMAAVLLLSLSAATFARYVSPEQVVVSKIIAPETFLVESDVLREDGVDYQLWQPAGPIPLALFNYEGTSRCSAMDVEYTITAVAYSSEDGTGGTVPCLIGSGDGADSLSAQAGSGTVSGVLTGGIARQAAYTVEPEGGDYSRVKKIVVTAHCGPYERDLTAVFHINSPEDAMYEIQDAPGNMAARLVIRGGGKESRCTVSWDGSLYGDRTDPLLEGAAGSQVAIDIGPAESIELLLFKADASADYSRQMQKILDERIEVSGH